MPNKQNDMIFFRKFSAFICYLLPNFAAKIKKLSSYESIIIFSSIMYLFWFAAR